MNGTLTFPGARIDLERRVVERADGSRERLTTLEVAVLEHLARRPGQPVTREELLAEVWGYAPSIVSRACDNTMHRLRTKIEVDPSDPEILITVHGGGYLLATRDRVLTRPPESVTVPARRIRIGERTLDLTRARVDGPDGGHTLTANEIAVIDQLVAAGGAAIDRDLLQRRIWGSGTGRPLESTISRLRRKLEPDPTRPVHLVTTAVGYRLELGAAAPPPPSPATEGPEDTLPAEVDARFGQAASLTEIHFRVGAGDRLLTLVGPGGVGKTRLALAAARSLGRSARWVDLADARTVDRMCATVAKVLRLQLDGEDPVVRIGFALQALGSVVVVLDNVEQLVPDGTAAIGAWTERAGSAVFLVTSRVPLRIRGERRVVVGALDPADAIALFEDRAIHPVDPSEHDELVALVEELDRVPLAIELAAARTGLMSVAEIRRRTSDRLRLLAVSDPSRPARHRSLRASLDATWALTGPAARSALGQLTVFAGGFTVDAAEDTLDLGAWPDSWTMDVVQELVDASLLRADGRPGRFVMPVIVHDYASEHLDPAERQGAEARHGRTYAELGSPEHHGWLDGPQGIEHRRALGADLDNLLLAAERALVRLDPTVALDAASAAWAVLELVGPYRLGDALVEPLLALPLADDQRARALLLAGRIQAVSGKLGFAERSLLDASRRAASLGSARLGAEAHLELCALRLLRDEPVEAEADAHVALTLARSLGEAVLECRALIAIGSVLKRQYRVEDGRRVLEAALRLAIESGALRREAEARRELGELLDRAGEDGGMQELERAARAAQDLGDRRLEATVLARTASSREALGRTWGNAPLERAALLFRELGDRVSELDAVLRSCDRLLHERAFVEAESRLVDAVRLAETIGADAARDEGLRQLANIRVNTGRLEEAEVCFQRALVGARHRDDRGLEVQILAERGNLLEARGDHDGARGSWETALELSRTLHNPYGEALLMVWLGNQSHALGRRDEAESWFQRSLVLARNRQLQNLVTMNLNNLGELRLERGATDEARGLLGEAVAVARPLGNPALLVQVLFSIVELETAAGQPDEARRTLDEADELLRDPTVGAVFGPRRDTLRAAIT